MGFLGVDWDSLYTQVATQVENAATDMIKTGVPALKSSAEQYAINWLTEQNKQTQEELKKNVGEVLQRPSDPNSFGGILSSNAANAFVSNYSTMILLGVGGVLLFGLYLKGK